MEPIRMFVGYDRDEPVGFSVFAHSVHRRSSVPVTIQPLMLSQIGHIYNRPREASQSTDFSFLRYLLPPLCGYRGWAIFADGDMICRADIAELWRLRNVNYSVMVVKRGEQAGSSPTKFLGRTQQYYQRKNWTSVMLMNCDLLGELTPTYVNRAPAMDLRQLAWLSDAEIGGLPAEWNHLVGVDARNPDAKIAHFTLGLPLWSEYENSEFAGEWWREREAMVHYRREPERASA